MKIKKYESNEIIIVLSIIFIIITITLFVSLFKRKEYKYDELTGIVLGDNLLIIVAEEKTRKTIYNNSSMYLNSKKEKYKIVEDNGVILTKDKNKYYELLVKIKFDKKYKSNDTIKLSIKTEKMRLIEMFKIIWEGG
ncbi:MAG: hypothetical protein HFE81_06205 [Bacilli bacterium]|nr:hypothetical protein [Bacilli bacterium]